MDKNFFVKTHGLGNEYIVFESGNISFELNESSIRKICNVNFGIGSDGILLKVPSGNADFGLRIFNPDGSEAEKSGNGLRIFAKYLFDYKHSESHRFTIETKGGLVTAEVLEMQNGRAKIIRVDMGKAVFNCKDIPVDLDKHECIDETLVAGDRAYMINCVSVGNPHCVIMKDALDIDEIKKYGSLIENHSMFPNRINVQFVKAISDSEVEILIWERGAGFTLASGSSSCGVAALMIKKGLTGRKVRVIMRGGSLEIEVDELWNIRMTGEVRQIAEGYLDAELIDDF